MVVSKRFYFNNLLKGRWLSNIHFKSLSRKEIVEYYRRSKAIIDLPHLFQTGLTMRVFEVLGAGKKLVTGNRYITKEPFYDKEHIFVIDADNPCLDVGFIERPMNSWNPKIEDYSISNWLRRLFS